MLKIQYVPQRLKSQLKTCFVTGFDSWYEQGISLQDEVLGEIMGLVAHSDYARDHGFEGITTKDEFKSRVPISDYADIEPYVLRNMKNDEHQLIDLDTAYYLVTTGAKGGQGKYFSETELGSIARQLVIDVYQIEIARKEAVMREPWFKTMPVLNSSFIPDALNGKAVRRTSGQAGKELWANGGSIFVFPYEFLVAPLSEEDRNYLYALYALKEKNLVQVNCNNLAAFGDFLDVIETKPLRMIEDIRTGHLSVDLDDTYRANLEALFEADPRRAQELEELLAENGAIDLEQAWPHFSLVNCWLGGSVGFFSSDTMSRLPHGVHYYNTPYGSTELMVSATTDAGSAAGPLAVFSAYFELLPLGGQVPIEMHEAIVGEKYELIVTTYSGLCRFNLHDVVRVTGFKGETACVEFLGRATEYLEIAGKKLYGFELLEIVESVVDPQNCTIRLCQGILDNGGLSLLMEFCRYPRDLKAFARELREAFKQRGYPLNTIYVVRNGYRFDFYRASMHSKLTVQSIKLPVMAPNAPAEDDVLATI